MKALPISLLALVLAGCAIMEPGQPPASPVQAQALGLRDTAVQWPELRWWRRYGDPQLDALVARAMAGSPGMLAAQARIAQANAALRQARAAQLPQVSAAYTLTRQRYTANGAIPEPLAGSVGTDNSLSLDFDYEIDFWGKRRQARQAEQARLASAQADAQAARAMLASAVVQSYLNLQTAYAQQAVLQETVAQRESVARLAQERFEAGLDTQVQARQAQSAHAQARVQAVQVRTRIAALRNQLAALAGAGPDLARTIGPADLAAVPPAAPRDVPLALLAHRPDIVAARLRAQASRHDVASAQAAFYPNVNLAAFVGLGSLGTGTLLEAGSRMAGIGPVIELPLFDGGRRNAALGNARAQGDLAVADYNETVLTAVRQVADALDGLRLIGEERAAQAQAQQAIEQAYALALDRYRNGLGDYLSVLLAQDGVLQQRQLATELRMRAYRLDADLAYALGGGYSPSQASTATLPCPHHEH
ncbi:efflux transporter outer membrane subunit [Orrella sp. JC864]|uniref:efflux transporter outer membrane subunit n=1 Tax=Orrella sp. JC864 TaxID=3120298 RepID=UPI0012BD63E3